MVGGSKLASHLGKTKLNAYLIYIEINSSWIKGSNVKKETIKILEKSMD